MEPDATHNLIAALADPDWQVSQPAAQALIHLGAAAVPALIAALNSPDEAQRSGVVAALEVIGDERAILPLIETTRRPDLRLGRQVSAALGRFGGAAAPLLADVLTNPAEPVNARCDAAQALGRSHSPAAVEPLRAALDDPELPVRLAAANGLAWLSVPEVSAGLHKAITHPAVEVRLAAAEALEWRTYYLEGIPPGGTALRTWLDEAARPALLAALNDVDERVRASAASGLAWCTGRQAVEALTAALADPASSVRANAASALGEHAEPWTVPALLRALEAGNPEAAAALHVIAVLSPHTPEGQAARRRLDQEEDTYR